MKTERMIRIVRDVLAMVTGSAGVIGQMLTGNWNPIALLVCATLLGVPLVNLRSLTPNGQLDTQESSSQSPPPSPDQPSSSPSSQPTSNGI